jgi:hypothetical protein
VVARPGVKVAAAPQPIPVGCKADVDEAVRAGLDARQHRVIPKKERVDTNLCAQHETGSRSATPIKRCLFHAIPPICHLDFVCHVSRPFTPSGIPDGKDVTHGGWAAVLTY